MENLFLILMFIILMENEEAQIPSCLVKSCFLLLIMTTAGQINIVIVITVYSAKFLWPGDSEGTLRSSSQAAICPPIYRTR